MISIVVPMYNASAYIENTIAMVQHQTESNWELILVDDKSQDDTFEKAQKYVKECGDPRIRIYEMPANGGPAKARNFGVAKARGDLLAFLDADDVWYPQKLEVEEAFLRSRNAAFVCHSYEFGNEKAQGTGKIVHVPDQLTYKKALTRTVVFTSTVMFDLCRLKKTDLYMPDCPSEDTALWWRLMREGTICYGLDEVLAVYRKSANSLSSNKLRQIQKVWLLYRKQENLGVIQSFFYLIGWGVRAALRRL